MQMVTNMWLNTSPESDSETLHVVGPTHLRSVDRRTFHAKGATKIDGDVTAESVVCKGTATIGGNVSVGQFRAEGATNVAGQFVADEASLNGTIRIEGELEANHLDSKGASRFADVDADAVLAKGTVQADTIEADEAVLRGVVDVVLIDADSVQISLSDDESTIDTIEADDITVERNEESESNEGRLEAGRVIGDVVAIEHTTAEEVVGDEVFIGPGSHVGLLRAERYEIDKGATVEATVEANE